MIYQIKKSTNSGNSGGMQQTINQDGTKEQNLTFQSEAAETHKTNKMNEKLKLEDDHKTSS